MRITSLRHAHENQLFNLKNELTELEYQNALFVIQENQRVIDAFNTIKYWRQCLSSILIYIIIKVSIQVPAIIFLTQSSINVNKQKN